MSARIAGYILILQSEKNHDSVERLNLADRITEVEKANNLYLDLDTQRGIVKEQKGLSTSLHKNCNGLFCSVRRRRTVGDYICNVIKKSQ